MSDASIHVLRIEGVQWIVERRHGSVDDTEGRQFFPNRAQAIAAGVALAVNKRAELVVHTRDGRVSRRRSFRDSLADAGEGI